MKGIIFFTGLVFLLFSCEKQDQPKPDPEKEPQPVYYYFYISGSDQSTEAGQYLPDSISIQIRNPDTYYPIAGMQVKFEVVSGGGAVDDDKVITDENGMAFTHWKLGTASHKQTVRVTFTDANDSILNGYYYDACGYRTDVWDTILCSGLPDMASMVVDTIRKRSYGIISGYPYSGLYSLGERFFDWEFTGTECGYSTSLRLDEEGNIFMFGSYEGVTMSQDQGTTWIPVNLPDPLQSTDNDGSIRLFTLNGIIWIYNYSGTLYRSGDMGLSWSADTAGFGRILQLDHLTGHPGGTVFVLVNGNIHKSVDNGLTWHRLKQMALYLQMAGNDLIAIDTDGNLLKSSDQGVSFTKVLNHYPNCILKYDDPQIAFFKGTYYVAVNGYGLKSTKDFITFKEIIYMPKINHVCIDHSGTIYIRRDNWLALYYRSSEL